MPDPAAPELDPSQKRWAFGAAGLFLLAVGFLGFSANTGILMPFFAFTVRAANTKHMQGEATTSKRVTLLGMGIPTMTMLQTMTPAMPLNSPMAASIS